MLKSYFAVTSVLLLVSLSACQSTTSADTLRKYIEAVQKNDIAAQKRFFCKGSGNFESSLEGIGDWTVISFQHPDEEGGGVFFVQSEGKTWEVAIRTPEVVYQYALKSANDINAGTARTQRVLDETKAMLGVESSKPSEPVEPLELPKRSDYSQEPYCVVNVQG
jgi:hypothetical protein